MVWAQKGLGMMLAAWHELVDAIHGDGSSGGFWGSRRGRWAECAEEKAEGEKRRKACCQGAPVSGKVW